MPKKRGGGQRNYALDGSAPKGVQRAPELDYRPPRPKAYRPPIGLIGCGGISPYHLRAYRRMRLSVVALCDLDRSLAEKRREDFYPRALVTTDYREVLDRTDIEVVDVATHPKPREQILEDSLRAGKHVLSQKPFVLDLKLGKKLAQLARRNKVQLAVNQNGRWAPHFSYLRQAVAAGLVGRVTAVDMAVHWDHNWVQGTPFDRIRHLLLYDFCVHWFDMVHCLLPDARPRRVQAKLFRAVGQAARPPLVGHISIEFSGATACLNFNGNTRFGPRDRTMVVGTDGTLTSEGPDINHQKITLTTSDGLSRPRLKGTWFTSGFEGTMGELLCAIEQKRTASHAAQDNLKSLELVFAAIASAERGQPVVPGTVTHLEPAWMRRL